VAVQEEGRREVVLHRRDAAARAGVLAQRAQAQQWSAPNQPPSAIALRAQQQLLAGVRMAGRVEPDQEAVGIEIPARNSPVPAARSQATPHRRQATPARQAVAAYCAPPASQASAIAVLHTSSRISGE
jgi:hypothetical protein